MSYATNKRNARTRTTAPTLTDQSQARETDINIIVGRYIHTGRAPGAAQQPMHGDFSQLPMDLRGFIESGRELTKHRRKLPKELQKLTVQELISLTPEQLSNILTPATTPPVPPAKEDPK